MVPEATCQETANTCGLYEPGRNRFAYVYHRTRDNAVRAYFRAVIGEAPFYAGELTIHTRPTVEKGWDKEFPCFIEIKSVSQACAAAHLLVAHAYPLSIKKWDKSRGINPPFRLAEELSPSKTDVMEGAATTILVNSYERNPAARAQCIEHYGPRCLVCGLDLTETYGEIARDFIHVHHLLPLSAIKGHHKTDPLLDLIPICPNCHAIVHRRNPPYSIAEIRAALKK